MHGGVERSMRDRDEAAVADAASALSAHSTCTVHANSSIRRPSSTDEARDPAALPASKHDSSMPVTVTQCMSTTCTGACSNAREVGCDTIRDQRDHWQRRRVPAGLLAHPRGKCLLERKLGGWLQGQRVRRCARGLQRAVVRRPKNCRFEKSSPCGGARGRGASLRRAFARYSR